MRRGMRAVFPTLLCVAAVLYAFPAFAQVPGPASPPCRSTQLKTSTAAPDGGLSHLAYAYQVTNTSTQVCSLEGAPSLRLADAKGREVNAPICAGCGDYLFDSRAAELVVLAPGSSAHFLLGAYHGDPATDVCRTFSRVEVEFPGRGKPLVFAFAGASVPTCGLHESAWRVGLFDEDKEFPGANPTTQEPLPFLHAHDVVLFQGDSITDGGRQRTGSDYNHIMGQDYAYILAAQIGAESPQRDLVFINRGNSGNRVPDLEARWQQDTIALHPQLLSILIGVNDLLTEGDRAQTAEQFEAAYDKLLAETVAALPATKIVLGEPFLMPVAKQKAAYATNIVEMKKRQAAVDRLAAKYHLLVVHYQQVFDAACAAAPPEHWSWDGVHPTYAGHGLMAREWLRTVDAFYGK